jgi:hypothetical protein
MSSAISGFGPFETSLRRRLFGRFRLQSGRDADMAKSTRSTRNRQRYENEKYSQATGDRPSAGLGI